MSKSKKGPVSRASESAWGVKAGGNGDFEVTNGKSDQPKRPGSVVDHGNGNFTVTKKDFK
jgi:hypothetical protein